MKHKLLRKVLAVSLAAAMMAGIGFTTAGQFIGTNVSVNAGAYIPNSTVWYDPTDITATSIALSGSGTFPAGAFGGYTSLQNITISGNVELPANAFKGMKSLRSIAFTGTTTKIPTSAFQGCTGITFVNYGNVVTIGESAFNGCTAYTSLSYATKVTSVGKSAFYNCTKLASVSLPNAKTIGASAFSNCTALNKVDLGSNVTTIGDYAFNKCSKLTAITLPKTVTSIGTGAFQGCTSLTISGYAGSTAETYAWSEGKNFNYLDHTNVTSVSLQSLSVEKGKTATITATVSPSNAYKKTLKWSSNNTDVATVNDSGVVTAVGAGTATITAKSHNGQTATCTVTVTEDSLALNNDSALSADKINLGDTITVMCSASGGTAPYQYQVLYKQKSSDKWSSAQSYSTNDTVSFKPTTASVYDICVKVKDSRNVEVKKYFEVTVTGSKIKNISSISASSIEFGKMVTVNAAASGSTGFYQYAVYTKKSSESKWSCKQSFDSNPIVNVKPNQATTYDICVKVRDNKGTVVKKYFTLEVIEKAGNLSNNSTVSNTEIALGEEIIVSAAANGGTGFYQYAVYCKDTNDTDWTTVQDYSAKNFAVIKPSKTSAYNICVKIKDSDNKESEKYFIVTVK